MRLILLLLFCPTLSFGQYYTTQTLTGWLTNRTSSADLRSYLYINNPTLTGIDTPILGLRAGYSDKWAMLIADSYLDQDVLCTMPICSGRLITKNTPQDIFVYNPGATNEGIGIQYNGIFAKNNASYFLGGLVNNSGLFEFRLTEPTTVTSGLYSTIRQSALSSSQDFYLPRNGGTFVMKASGYDTQNLTLNTTMTVTHGQPFTPSSIQWTQVDFLPSGGQLKISAITSTTFTITFSVPQTGTYSGYYMCYP